MHVPVTKEDPTDFDWLQPAYKFSGERVKLYTLQGLGVSSEYLKTLLSPLNSTVILVVLLVSVIDIINVVFSLTTGWTLQDKNKLLEVAENSLRSKTSTGSPRGKHFLTSNKDMLLTLYSQ